MAVTDPLPALTEDYGYVIEQWYYDTYQTQPAKGYDNYLYSCLQYGAVKYLQPCKFGCVVTPDGKDDYCRLGGTFPKRPFRQQQLKLSLHSFGFGASGG